MFKNSIKALAIVLLVTSFISCEGPEDESSASKAVIRAGESLSITNSPLDDLSLGRAKVICEALEEHHDNILRSVFQEDFIFSRRQKPYGERSLRDLSNVSAYIEIPTDYESTPMFRGRRGGLKYFVEEIPTENNLYMKQVCDYVLNGVGNVPKIQQKVQGRYHVFNFVSNERLNIGIYTKNSNGNYYLYRSLEYRFNVSKTSRYYGMAIEQSEIFIRDYRASDFSLIYQKFERVD